MGAAALSLHGGYGAAEAPSRGGCGPGGGQPPGGAAAHRQELSGLVGFQVTADFSLPFEAERTVYRSYWNEMAEIECSGGGYSTTYRQSPGTADNSGDYNTYSDRTEISVNGRRVTLKGGDGLYVLAVWTDGKYAYSLSLSPGIAESGWQDSLSP